jgi:hypothetical protein
VKRHSYLFAAFSVGKLTRETCGRMLGVLSSRVAAPGTGGRLEVFTDGNDDYVRMLPVIFRVENLSYGQLVKVKDERGKLMGKERRVVFGDPDLGMIETVNVENFNGILRERLGRLVRRTKCISKERRRLWCAVCFFQFYWNFVSQIRRGKTPAMMEGLSPRVWTWHDFFYYELNHLN